MDCTKLVPSMKFSDKQKPHFVTFYIVLNIVYRNSGYMYIIPCTAKINAEVVIHIFEKHIKRTISLPFSIVLDQDIVFVSAEFQDYIIANAIKHKVSTT